MMKSMKKMLLMAAVAVMAVSLAAPAAMADEVRDHRDGSSSSSGIDKEEPLKDPGIRQCDLVPPGCDEEPLKDPGIRQCDITPSDCRNTADEEEDSATHESQVVCIKAPCPGSSNSASGEEEDHLKDHGIRQCDLTPPGCPVEEESKEEKASVPGGVKVAEVPGGIITSAQGNDPSAPKVVSAPADEAGQTTDSGTIHGCPFDYEYIEEIDMCLPSEGDYEIFETIMGETPLPDSVGGYISLLGDVVEDPVVGAGTLVQLGLGYVEDALLWYGEDGGPIGAVIQGVGYGIGFAGDAAGAVLGGVGEAAGAVADGVGEAIDSIGDAAGDAYDEIASWF